MSEPLKMVIDVLEGDTVRVELDGQAVYLPRRCVPAEAGEGDFLVARLELVDSEEARKKAQEATDRLSAGDDGGDIEL